MLYLRNTPSGILYSDAEFSTCKFGDQKFYLGGIFVVIGIMGSAAEQRHKTSFLLDQVMTRKHLYPRKQLKNRTPGSMLHSCTKGHGT